VRLENSFEVPAPPEAAWQLLTDVPRVVPCMPGATLTEVVDENTFKATMAVKLGPIGLQFGTDIVRDTADETAHTTRMTANARELKGRGGARATIESSLEPAGEGTKVTVVTDLALQGAVAQYGRGVVADVANQLVVKFAECLAAQLQEGDARSDGASGAAGSTALAGNGAASAAPAAPASPQQPAAVPINGLTLVLKAMLRPITRLFHRR
jgi:carbon monoxide dehydrogenase subunit G